MHPFSFALSFPRQATSIMQKRDRLSLIDRVLHLYLSRADVQREIGLVAALFLSSSKRHRYLNKSIECYPHNVFIRNLANYFAILGTNIPGNFPTAESFYSGDCLICS